MKRRITLLAVLASYIIFLIDLALFHFPADHPQPNWVPLRSIIFDLKWGGWNFVINFLGNLVAFLPMGLIPPLIWPERTRLWQVMLLSLTISVAIETGQFVSGRRLLDVDDLLLNSVGGLLGYLVFCGVRKQQWRRFNMVSAQRL